MTVLTEKTFKNAEKRLKRVLSKYLGRKEQLAIMNWSLNIELQRKQETNNQLEQSGMPQYGCDPTLYCHTLKPRKSVLRHLHLYDLLTTIRAVAGLALQTMGSMMDQQEGQIRELEVDLDKERVKRRRAEKNAQEAEDELQVVLSRARLEGASPVLVLQFRSASILTLGWAGHNEMLELVRELEEEIRNLKAQNKDYDRQLSHSRKEREAALEQVNASRILSSIMLPLCCFSECDSRVNFSDLSLMLFS